MTKAKHNSFVKTLFKRIVFLMPILHSQVNANSIDVNTQSQQDLTKIISQLSNSPCCANAAQVTELFLKAIHALFSALHQQPNSSAPVQSQNQFNNISDKKEGASKSAFTPDQWQSEKSPMLSNKSPDLTNQYQDQQGAFLSTTENPEQFDRSSQPTSLRNSGKQPENLLQNQFQSGNPVLTQEESSNSIELRTPSFNPNQQDASLSSRELTNQSGEFHKQTSASDLEERDSSIPNQSGNPDALPDKRSNPHSTRNPRQFDKSLQTNSSGYQPEKLNQKQIQPGNVSSSPQDRTPSSSQLTGASEFDPNSSRNPDFNSNQAYRITNPTNTEDEQTVIIILQNDVSKPRIANNPTQIKTKVSSNDPRNNIDNEVSPGQSTLNSSARSFETKNTGFNSNNLNTSNQIDATVASDAHDVISIVNDLKGALPSLFNKFNLKDFPALVAAFLLSGNPMILKTIIACSKTLREKYPADKLKQALEIIYKEVIEILGRSML